MNRLFFALLAASAVSALSPSCQNALTSVATNTDANACLGVSALTSAFLQVNSSFIPQVENLVNTLCAAQPCSNTTLSAVVANITNGCSTELSAAGSSDSTTATVTGLVQQYYSVARQIVCLKDNDASGTNCLVQTLNNIQSTYGQLSISSFQSTLSNIEATTSLPTNITCTTCLKQALNLIDENFPSTGATLKSDVEQCGSNFTDGASPTNIVETAASTSAGSNSAKAKLMGLDAVAGAGTVGTLIVSSLLAMLA
ncbi:hypothetical protein C8F01DRAFT_1243288 [Mycena amicta]|nr:hypothetical protein C8F01DRAFT_1243288 [Mycena amicta]